MATGAVTLQKFFGRKDRQTLAEFAAEVNELGDEGKAVLVSGIEDGSLTY